MRQQLVDAAVQVGGQPGEHVLEIRPRVMPVQLGRLQQAHDHGGALACQFAAGEEPLFRPIAQGRIRFSQWLLSIGTSPSSRKRVSAPQRFRL